MTIEGKLPMNPNDLDVALDGTIYWSDSSTHSYLNDAVDEFLGEPSGRLASYGNTASKYSSCSCLSYLIFEFESQACPL